MGVQLGAQAERFTRLRRTTPLPDQFSQRTHICAALICDLYTHPYTAQHRACKHILVLPCFVYALHISVPLEFVNARIGV
jgi:hypothetical protein